MAEIAAAFAGFAALVSVIRRASGQPADAVHDLLRLRLVISSSVAGGTALIAKICQAGFVFVRFVGSAFRHQSETLSEV